jgi:2-hydroxychromene-2-carboxylate isomerase
VSQAAVLGASPLTVALDVRDPLAFLALGPAIRFGQELGIAIDWLPFAAEPRRRPALPGDDDDRGVRHRRHRARMIAREIAVYAQAQGLVVREPYRSGSADALNLGWLWLRAHAAASLPDFLEEAFRRYWAIELDASDRNAVAELVAAQGGEGARFLAWADGEGPAVLATVASDLSAAGVRAVPTYLACDQLFLGRQHLPMIRWLLEGQTGPVPI